MIQTTIQTKEEIDSIHGWMRHHYGSPKVCESPDCLGKSKWFDWCKRSDKPYARNRDNFLRMCRICHRKYDLTPEKKAKALENLWWKKGIKNPGKPIEVGQKLNPKGSNMIKRQLYKQGLKDGASAERARIVGIVEEYFKGLVHVPDPQATLSSLLTKIRE